jgi:hypothetical protein
VTQRDLIINDNSLFTFWHVIKMIHHIAVCIQRDLLQSVLR